MSWLGDFGALADTLGTEGAQVYARGAIMAGAAREGLSANRALGVLHSAGLGIRRADFLRAYSAARSALTGAAGAANIPLESARLPTGMPPAPSNWTGQYLHQVTVIYRQPGEAGTNVVLSRTLGIKSSTVLSPFEAAQGALGIVESPIEDEAESGYPSPSQVLSVQLTGMWYDTRGNLVGGLL